MRESVSFKTVRATWRTRTVRERAKIDQNAPFAFAVVCGTSLNKSQYYKINFVIKYFCIKVKPLNIDYHRDTKFVSVVDRWLLFRGSFMLQTLKVGPHKIVVAEDKWSLFRGGR